MPKAQMVLIHEKGLDKIYLENRLTELKGLIEATGAEVCGALTQARERPEGGLGRGALERLQTVVQGDDVNLVVFDGELSPREALYVQSLLGETVQVVDRTQVILDIFARRAASREGQVQVELAQYRYLEPRLRSVRRSSRPGAGIGTRGPGETQLELDRRRVSRRIAQLSQELDHIERMREERRQRRHRTELARIALVGYTNVGKSTLYAQLTQRPQRTGNALFVTLDSTVRRMMLSNFGPVLVSDTVGFVDNLPHHLIAAFRSTLDEVRDADLLLEVINAHPEATVTREEQREVIAHTLKALGADRTPRVLVYNQWDAVSRTEPYPLDGVAISAIAGEGIPQLMEAMQETLMRRRRQLTIRVSWSDDEVWKVIYRELVILHRADYSDFAELVLTGSEAGFHQLRQARGQCLVP